MHEQPSLGRRIEIFLSNLLISRGSNISETNGPLANLGDSLVDMGLNMRDIGIVGIIKEILHLKPNE